MGTNIFSGARAFCNQFHLTSQFENMLGIWQVNEAQLHGALSSKYSSYRPALNGVANTYATGVSTRLPLR